MFKDSYREGTGIESLKQIWSQCLNQKEFRNFIRKSFAQNNPLLLYLQELECALNFRVEWRNAWKLWFRNSKSKIIPNCPTLFNRKYVTTIQIMVSFNKIWIRNSNSNRDKLNHQWGNSRHFRFRIQIFLLFSL